MAFRLSGIQLLTICPKMGETSTRGCVENYKPNQVGVKQYYRLFVSIEYMSA